MKKFITLAASAALFAAALVPAIAASNDCSNSTTGPFSNNSCTIKNSDKVDVDNVNDAYVVNNVTANSNSGHNEANLNTLGGTIITGDATTNLVVSTVANINTTNITSGDGNGNNSGTNGITGPYSNNRVWIENESDIDVWNSNTAQVFNDVYADSNTGYNKANTNTGPASISTGDAWLNLAVLNHVNDNYTQIMGGAGGGNNVAENLTTGPFSRNSVSIKNKNKADVDNVNDMLVENYVDANSNSGYNEAKTNTLGGEIITGGAAAGVGVSTEGNINTTLIAMALGGFDNYGSNSVTGPAGEGQDPYVWIENEREVYVDNWNNKCKSHNADDQFGDWVRWGKHWFRKDCDVTDLGVFNDVYADSDTGYNLANTNTGGGGVLSGYADLLQQVLVHMNDSLTEILP